MVAFARALNGHLTPILVGHMSWWQNVWGREQGRIFQCIWELLSSDKEMMTVDLTPGAGAFPPVSWRPANSTKYRAVAPFPSTGVEDVTMTEEGKVSLFIIAEELSSAAHDALAFAMAMKSAISCWSDPVPASRFCRVESI
ncbi:uncharacterized protein CIMG_08212 [Coccidioides immitis RS]|uniref:Uncharacterized protein n=1 Tax=Coccidioides immitis (strain RS) TaxID=246410 RepID=A0A0D8JU51_COCIM|nr:uncharacterized protein CIMG_08212 [Coccidioides immitis RS]KJF60817.1 hypothetical protein CIMG_08212 [Coccidioides immitis RS]